MRRSCKAAATPSVVIKATECYKDSGHAVRQAMLTDKEKLLASFADEMDDAIEIRHQIGVDLA